jgi:hypothetical protein
MKGAILTIVVTEMAILTAAAIPSLADDLPPLNSQWRETQRGSCFEISQILDPFPGYANCAQIAGRMNEHDLMIGYACKTGSDMHSPSARHAGWSEGFETDRHSLPL